MRLGFTQVNGVCSALVALVFAGALLCAGCGSSSSPSGSSSSASAAAQRQAAIPSTSGTAPAPRGEPESARPQAEAGRSARGRSEHVPRASIEVSIPVLASKEASIPVRYTCDGADVSLPVSWSGIPHGTAQLALFVLNLNPSNGIFVDWALTGISPTSHGVTAGEVPPGAVVARNSFGKTGYSICPPKGSGETYIVRVLGLPHPLTVGPGSEGQAVYRRAEQEATYSGIASALYKRP